MSLRRDKSSWSAPAGFGAHTHIHAVGDGAPWIADQVEDQFGAQGSYLLDFYPVCDYLSAAAKTMVGEPAAQAAWMDEQKTRLKTRRAGELLQALQPHLEEAGVADAEAPVRQCHRYLSHRPDQLHYRSAIERDLPIGSGEIESAHRYIVQQRLKRPGGLVVCDQCRTHAGLTPESSKPAVECVLGNRYKASTWCGCHISLNHTQKKGLTCESSYTRLDLVHFLGALPWNP